MKPRTNRGEKRKMFERRIYQCPSCGSGIRQDLADVNEFVCAVCGRRFRVLMTDGAAEVGFVEVTAAEIPEPLSLPKGSIRAIVTLGTSVSSWILMFRGDDVPEYLLSLLLAIIGYYFGFRKKMKAADSRILDASAETQEPLFLPSGLIRWFLIGGFAAAAVALHARGELVELEYVGFFAVLAGLVAGYFFAKLLAAIETTSFCIFVNHLKGVVALASAAFLALLLLSGHYSEYPIAGLALASIISFYFGSRS